MTCGFSQERLALYVEGDLPDAQSHEVERHLSECEVCRGFTAELRESQFILKSLRQETISATALVGVRQKVLEYVEAVEGASSWRARIERRVLLGFRRVALAALAVIVVGAGVLWRFSTVSNTPDETVQVDVAPPPVAPLQAVVAATDVAPAEPVVNRPRRRQQTKPAPVVEHREFVEFPEPPQPSAWESKQVVVKMFTDDPSVVIYWLLDEKEGGE